MGADETLSVAVVGAGQAAAALAAKLRAEGHRGPITLIGAEPAPPYQRPPLSKKYLLGDLPKERLFLRPQAFWDENDIRLRLGAPVEEIDRAAGRLRLAGGESLAWDRLVLATGARPRRLPADMGGGLPGVHVLRDLADTERLGAELRPGARALVVGGGYIGLEAAAVFAGRGLQVVLIEAAERILARVAAAETADWFRDLHAARGVTIREGAGLLRLEGGDRLRRAVLADGSALEVDFALVGIGVVPNDDLARAAGLAVDGGIDVDGFAATSDGAVFAVGDVARFGWRGRRIRLESVQNAIDQAEAAALAILGRGAPYAPVPWFWSDQYDVKLQIAGLGQGADRVVTRPGGRPGAASHWYFKGLELLAVDAMNDPRAYMTGKRWLEAGASPDPDRLADPGADLRTL